MNKTLTVGQRAMAALDNLSYEEEKAKARKLVTQNNNTSKVLAQTFESRSELCGRARDIAAKQFHINGRRVEEARCIRDNSPEITELVVAGKISLNKALCMVKDLNFGSGVYLIGPGIEIGPTKIGMSKNGPVNRLKTLQVANWIPLKIIKWISCLNAREIESGLHLRYHHKLVLGEWFNLTIEDICNIESIVYKERLDDGKNVNIRIT